ncbi:MAG: PIG-L family deacetylase, partial [Chloroflexi bacterium]|nr:PIG-L family deacetylase [Chloroflexota bacterium]
MTTEPAAPTPVLVVGAHPDDPEFGAGGSVARWVRDGRPVTYVVMTRGDKGSHDLAMTAEGLMATRETEQRGAAAELGVTDVRFLGCRDCEVEASLDVRRKLVRIIREVRPGTVVTHDP